MAMPTVTMRPRSETKDRVRDRREGRERSGDAFEQTVAAAAALFSGVIAAYPGGTFCHSLCRLPPPTAQESKEPARHQAAGDWPKGNGTVNRTANILRNMTI